MKGRIMMNMSVDQRACIEHFGSEWDIVGESCGMPVISNGAAYYALSPKNPDKADPIGCAMPVRLRGRKIHDQAPAE